MENSVFLFIGPCKCKKSSVQTGGVIVLFNTLLQYCKKHDIPYSVVDTNKRNYRNRYFALFSIFYQLIRRFPNHTHISLHGTANDFLFIAPFIVFFNFFFKKHISLRKFAGNFDAIYKSSSPLTQYIIKKTLLHSSVNFFETKYLVDFFKPFNKNTYWFPNVREKSDITVQENYQKKLIYIGAINKEKGIEVLCETANLLPEEYTIDLYGPLHHPFTSEYFKKYNVNYKGPLASEKVIEVMSSYNILVLPSFREGYPGVIIEAFSIGLPVIATNLQGIQEMVTMQSGILIEPGNSYALKKAILTFNQNNYRNYRLHALKQFTNFDTEIQTANFFKRLNEDNRK